MMTTPISKRMSRTAVVLGAGVLGLGTVGTAVAVTTPGDAAESSVASHVHAELTGDPDLQPGDEGFGLAVAQPDAVDGPAVAEAASQGRSTTPDTEDAATDEDGEDSSDEAEAGRSATAEEVLEGLTEDGELMPGDEGFGEAVADHARSRGEDADEADTTADDADGPPEDVPASDQADDRADEATDADGPPEDVPASDQADDRADEGAGNADVADDYRPTDPPTDAGPPDNPGN